VEQANGDRRQTAGRLRVLVIDADPLARRTIRDLLSSAEILVVGEARDGRDMVRAALHYKPDIILLDTRTPGVEGSMALEQVAPDGEVDAKLVILSVRGQHDLDYPALESGAIGYLNKDLDLNVLPRVLHDVAVGVAAPSRTVAPDAAGPLGELPGAGIGMRLTQSVLTTREWEIVDQLCMGRSTEVIAEALVLSIETVRTHIKNIMRKLDLHSRADVVTLVQRLRAGDLAARAALSPPLGPRVAMH
jgi:two-component system, NarL family, response regulator LiaR